MTVANIAWTLALLIPLSSAFCALSLQRSGLVPRVFWVGLWMIHAVPLGGFLAAMVVTAFGEQPAMAPFYWIENPILTAKVFSACGLVGAVFSYGLTRLAELALTGRTAD